MALAFVSAEFLTAMAILVLLVGVPLFVVAVIAVVSAYIRYDSERYLEELETEAEAGTEPGDGSIRDDG